MILHICSSELLEAETISLHTYFIESYNSPYVILAFV